MLPNYRAFDVEKRIKRRTGVKNEHKELMILVKAFKDMVDMYNWRKERYAALDENDIGKDEFYKTRKEYEHDFPILRAAIDKDNKNICFWARSMGIIKPTEVGDIKEDKEQGKSAFRSGESQGRGVIRNMNKITGTALKRFK